MKAFKRIGWGLPLALALCAATVGWSDDGPRGKKGPPGNAENRMAQAVGGPTADGGGADRARGEAARPATGNFDPSTFSASMIQQFDQDGDAALNQGELASCLSMLYQQVQQQQQMIAQSAQQQLLQQMSGGAGQAGCAGGGAGGTASPGASFAGRAGATRGGAGGQGGGSIRGGAGAGGPGGRGGR